MKHSAKRVLALLLALVCLFSFAACAANGNKTGSNKPTSENPSVTSGNEDTTEPPATGDTDTSTPETEPPTSGNNVPTNNDTPHTHSYGAWMVATEAGCTADGLQERVCACGDKQSEIIPALGHNYENGVCTRCGEIDPDATPAFSEGIMFEYNTIDQSYIGDYLLSAERSIFGSYEIREGTKSIADSAFDCCSSLTSITISEGVMTIGDYAFQNCSSLTSITIPDGVTSIGFATFSGCSSLKSIKLPNSVTSISYGAFLDTAYYNNKNNWKDGVLYIDNNLIVAQESLSGAYAIREGTTCIADSAFYNFGGLTSITIPDSVTSIGSSAFAYCSSLTSITIPDSVTSIGDEAFRDCGGFTSITVAEGNTTYHSVENSLIEIATGTLIVGCKKSVLPTDGSVTSIGPAAFSGCGSLTSITIPDRVMSIGDAAFRGCSSLKSIKLPETITRIGYTAFSGCSSLTSITFNGTMEQWNTISKGYRWDESTDNYTIHCADGDIEK